jgi:hypothetical protein
MTMTFRCAAVAMVLLAAGTAFSQEAGTPSAEQQAMMEAYQRAAALGPQHAMLAKMAGDFALTVKSYMEPGAEPEVSAATATRRLILGGRFLEEVVKGTMMGAPFEGRGISGYDNVSGDWWGTWIDNMSTGIMISRGEWDDAAGVGSFTGEFNDAVTGKVQTSRMTSQRLPNGDEIMEMYMPTPGGEVKAMEILYKRR